MNEFSFEDDLYNNELKLSYKLNKSNEILQSSNPDFLINTLDELENIIINL